MLVPPQTPPVGWAWTRASGCRQRRRRDGWGVYGPNRFAEDAARTAMAGLPPPVPEPVDLDPAGLRPRLSLGGDPGSGRTPVVIVLVVLLNATTGFVQESRAEDSLEALKQMLVATATVRRDGRTVRVDAAELVPPVMWSWSRQVKGYPRTVASFLDLAGGAGILAHRRSAAGRQVRRRRGRRAGPGRGPNHCGLHEHHGYPWARRGPGHCHRDGNRDRPDRPHAA